METIMMLFIFSTEVNIWLITLVLFELYILGNVIHDWWLIEVKNDQIINKTHKYEALKQLGVITVMGLVVSYPVYSGMFNSLKIFSISLILILSNIGIFGFWFFLQFDYLLNCCRKKPWEYLGDSWTDRILKGYKLRYYRLAVKILLLLIVIGIRFGI